MGLEIIDNMDGKELLFIHPVSDEEMDKFINQRIELIKSTLLKKAKEYARNGDRLHNFNKGSKLYEKPREQVIYDFMQKHLISFDDMMRDLNSGDIKSIFMWEEKLGDIINYLVLLEASLKHRLLCQSEEATQN